MVLQQISIVNYKNIANSQLELSPKINCFIGNNGEGKTNVLDTIYFLSFAKSANNPIDSQIVRHGEDFFMLDATYVSDSTDVEQIYCGMKKGRPKILKRNKKAYKKLSEHIGLLPLIMIAPADSDMIDGGSEERRHLMDIVIAQYDHQYIQSLSRYNKALQQRNAMLKNEETSDQMLMELLEQEMAQHGKVVYQARETFIKELTPIFQTIYRDIANGEDNVSLEYVSHCQRGDLLEVIQRDRHKDQIMGYSLHGIHRDDINFMLDGFQMKREGSQGQRKTFIIAMKLAQFFFLKQHDSIHQATSEQETPILLLDDIFDKLDSTRVEQIIKLVSGEQFGQIFITDTNREHLDKILQRDSIDYKLFEVKRGEIMLKEDYHV